MALFDGGLLGGGGLASMAEEMGRPASTQKDDGDDYPRNYTTDRFDSFGGALTHGKPVEIARDMSPAGIARRWGLGSAKQPDNQGFAFGIFQNSGDGTADSEEQIHGTLIFQWENSTGRETQVVHEIDTRDIDTADRYDRDQQVPVPEQTDKNKAAQDESLVVLFEAETDPADIVNDYAISQEFSTCRLPATEYDVS